MNPTDSIIRLFPGNRMFLRVFALFGGLLLALTIVYGLLIIPLQRDSLLKVMYSQASTVSRSIIQACSDAMLTDDYGFIVEHNLQVLQNNKSILSVQMVPKRGSAMRIAPEGWVMLEGMPEEFRQDDFEQESYGIVQAADGSSHYHYAAPILFSGVSWGAMLIDFDASEYEANIDEMYRQLLYISLISLVVILPIGYFFALWLTRPIATISAAASRVAHGDLDVRVDIARRDEIGDLSHSFNQMVTALADNRRQLENVNLDLEIKVRERTQALDDLNRTLDQRVRDEVAKRKEQEQLLIHQSRLAAMGEMIGAIAHQWRQPLNALSLVLQNIGLQHKMGRLTDESMARLLEKGEAMVSRMSTTIDDFRNFFKPAKHAEPFNLSAAIQSAVGIVDGMFKNHSILLHVDCPEDIQVTGYMGEFSQVVLNILGNAKDALLDSGQAAPVIRILTQAEGDKVRIRFVDNGGGIAPEVLPKIWEPYFTTKDEGQGTGIGLYMSKMIIENNMHGRLEVQNVAGGAQFTVTLARFA